jgi:AcrR family transcriptional regulator
MTTHETGRADRRMAGSPRIIRRRDRKIQEILTAAALLVCRHGYGGFSLDALAESLDVTKGSLYHYFRSRDELIAACIESIGIEVNGRLEATASAKGSSTERLEALIREQLNIVLRDHPESLQIFLLPGEWPGGQRTLIKELRRRHNEIFRGVISAGVGTGEFQVTSLDMSLHCLYGALNYVPIWCMDRSIHGVDLTVREFTETVMALFANR